MSPQCGAIEEAYYFLSYMNISFTTTWRYLSVISSAMWGYHGGSLESALWGDYVPCFLAFIFHQLYTYFTYLLDSKTHDLLTFYSSPFHGAFHSCTFNNKNNTNMKEKVGYLPPSALVLIMDRHIFFVFFISFLFFFKK